MGPGGRGGGCGVSNGVHVSSAFFFVYSVSHRQSRPPGSIAELVSTEEGSKESSVLSEPVGWAVQTPATCQLRASGTVCSCSVP